MGTTQCAITQLLSQRAGVSHSQAGQVILPSTARPQRLWHPGTSGIFPRFPHPHRDKSIQDPHLHPLVLKPPSGPSTKSHPCTSSPQQPAYLTHPSHKAKDLTSG